MANLEERVAALEKGILLEQFRSALINIQFHLYKAEVCKGRWGSPGGNDIGYLELGRARQILQQTPWDADLKAPVAHLDQKIAIYAEYIKNMDITMVSYEESRMKEAFKTLENAALGA